ncbi:MAG: LysR family transcriptional regulator [Pseudomonadota bacterium]
MRLEWLEDILAVADTGSFTEAAERRHLTASAFSRRVQQVEDHLGVELFDRTRKPIQLRPTTELNKEEIARLAGALRQLGFQLQRASRMSGNRAVLASQHALTTSFTPQLLQQMLAKHEELFLRLRSANSQECYNLLLTRQADIALLYERPLEPIQPDAPYLERITVGADRLIPVIGVTDVEHINRAFSRGVLPVIAYPDEVFLGVVMDRTVLPRMPAGTEAVPRAETALTLAALELATAGVGVAWVPKSLARRPLAAGEIHDLSDTLPSCDLSIAAFRLNDAPTEAGRLIWDLMSGTDVGDR